LTAPSVLIVDGDEAVRRAMARFLEFAVAAFEKPVKMSRIAELLRSL